MFGGYKPEEEYLNSLKQSDHYHFSVPFEYIEKNYGNGEYDIANAVMEVDVNWDDYEHGYRISFYCPDMYKIDPAEGNGSEESFYDSVVEDVVLGQLDSMGITSEARVSGTGR